MNKIFDPAALAAQTAMLNTAATPVTGSLAAAYTLADFGLTETQVPELEERMRPGQSSIDGFLGHDESLVNVLVADRATLAAFGISHIEIAQLLDHVVSGVIYYYQVEVGDRRFGVTSESYNGHQECPYKRFVKKTDSSQCCEHACRLNWSIDVYHRGSHDYTVIDLQTGDTLEFGGLLVHLIREHQFFEGKGTRYRLSPERVISFFGMDKGNRTARIIETPAYLYEAYAINAFRRLQDIESFYNPHSSCGGPIRKTILENSFKSMDALSFMSPEVIKHWKQRVESILDIRDEKPTNNEDRRKLEELRSLGAEMENAVILSTGYIPEKFHFDGTASGLAVPAMERFRGAKALKKLVQVVDSQIKREDHYFFGGRHDLSDWIYEQVHNRNTDYPVCRDQYAAIRSVIADISTTMSRNSSYEEAKVALDRLLISLNDIAETEFTDASAELSAQLRKKGIEKEFS